MQNNPENTIELLLDFLQKREDSETTLCYQNIQQVSEKIEPALVQKFYSIPGWFGRLIILLK